MAKLTSAVFAVATSIVTDVRNTAFGRIRQVSHARVVQIGARVTF